MDGGRGDTAGDTFRGPTWTLSSTSKVSQDEAVRDQRAPWFTVMTFRTMCARGWMVDRTTKCVAPSITWARTVPHGLALYGTRRGLIFG